MSWHWDLKIILPPEEDAKKYSIMHVITYT